MCMAACQYEIETMHFSRNSEEVFHVAVLKRLSSQHHLERRSKEGLLHFLGATMYARSAKK